MSWTVTASVDKNAILGSGERQFTFKLACTSDANASGDQTLSTLLNTALGSKQRDLYMNRIRGGFLFGVEYEPDGSDTPTSNPTVTIDNENGTLILSREFTADAADFEPGTNQTGMYVPITDMIIASSTLDNGKKASIRIIVNK